MPIRFNGKRRDIIPGFLRVNLSPKGRLSLTPHLGKLMSFNLRNREFRFNLFGPFTWVKRFPRKPRP